MKKVALFIFVFTAIAAGSYGFAQWMGSKGSTAQACGRDCE